MKKILRIVWVIIICLAMVSCAPNTAPTSTAESNSPVEGQTASGETPQAPAETPTATQEVTTATVQFYESTAADPIMPQYKLFIDPVEGETPVPVSVNCGGVESLVYAPFDGVTLNNHCVLTTAQAGAYAVLPDGSVISIGIETTLQINLEEGSSEIILQAGEIFNQVAPQGDDRHFIVLTGDTSVEAQGTKYYVSQKNQTTRVFVSRGETITRRCNKWKQNTCQTWNELVGNLYPFKVYSTSVGSNKWSNEEMVDTKDPASYKQMELALADESADVYELYYLEVQNGFHYDEDNSYNGMIYIQNKLLYNNYDAYLDFSVYDQNASDLNQSISAFCANNPDNCPIIANNVPVETPEQPTMSEPNPSGRFPDFDRGSCFTRDGHLWCYPVAGSVDPTMAGEWDITEICRAYPGEIPCSWPEVKQTLP